MSGVGLSILNVGEGDKKVSFDKDKPKEVERAREIVQDMLKRGYAVLIQVGEKDGKPLYLRATEFDPKTDEYIVAGTIEEPPTVEASNESAPPSKKGKKWRVPAEKTPGVGVARSSGGMSVAADSVELENLRSFDAHHQARTILKRAAVLTGEWAGMPMPLRDRPLVFEPNYPWAKFFKELQDDTEVEKLVKAEKPLDALKMRSHFYSTHLRSDIFIWEEDGKIVWGLHPAAHSLIQQIGTIDASDAWGIEQEATALQLLATLLNHVQYKRYLLTGMFLESSSRSGLTYIFRRLRPTVALSFRNFDGSTQSRIIATLCMHPIAYYQNSWAGAMCPTDDVIAHLMLMRGDEKMFWRRSNQHQAFRPEAGM